MNYGVILAGGIGSRMQHELPKQYIVIEGKPVLVYTLEKFQKCSKIDRFIIVADEFWREDIKGWLKEYSIDKFLDFADPGPTRQDSVFSGLCKCMEYSKSPEDIVVVHEAARALASVELISNIVDGLSGFDACVPVLPMNDSIIFSETGETIDELLDRSKLFCGQAPESFYLHPYWELNSRFTAEDRATIRADHELCFKNQWKIHNILGEENNFKLTTPGDINRMISLIKAGKA